MIGSKLIGVEYIVSGEVFDTFAEDEKQYWHPHNYEIISACSSADAPDDAERGLMEMLVNSYGKTWHMWHTGRLTASGCLGTPRRPACRRCNGHSMLTARRTRAWSRA